MQKVSKYCTEPFGPWSISSTATTKEGRKKKKEEAIDIKKR